MRFRKPRLWSRKTAGSSLTLPFPAAPHLRTALLGEIDCFDGVASYPGSRWRQLSLFQPNILAGETNQLDSFASLVFQGRCDVATLDVAIFAFTMVGRDMISSLQRERLWRAFHVPIYELLVDRDAGVLAAECETHEGWHIRHRQLRFELQTGRIIFQKHGPAASPVSTGLMAGGLDGVCACGDDAPILRNIRPHSAKQTRARAAIA